MATFFSFDENTIEKILWKTQFLNLVNFNGFSFDTDSDDPENIFFFPNIRQRMPHRRGERFLCSSSV